MCSAAAGSPVQNILVRPVSRQGSPFTDKFLENSSLLCRMTSLLMRLGLYEGESLHSFRRGVAQQLKAHGSSDSAILQQMLIKTPAMSWPPPPSPPGR